MRQSFLPGFDDDLPFVLVDVALDEPRRPAAHRPARRRSRRRRSSSATAVDVVFEQLADGVAVPAFALAAAMTAPFPARNRSRSSATHRAPIVDHVERPLGAVAVDIARAAIADAGLAVDDVDGFIASSLLPTAGDHAIVDGVSTVTPNWLAQHLGVQPALRHRLPGLRTAARARWRWR